MKNLEKIVPVAVAGLVLAAGTLDAHAEEAIVNDALPQAEGQPVQEEQKETGAPDTTIHQAVELPKATETAPEPPKTETPEAPKAEASEVEAPKAEDDEAETPKTEAPETEVPEENADDTVEIEITESEVPKAETPEDGTALVINPGVTPDENGNPVITDQGQVTVTKPSTTENEDGTTTETPGTITGEIIDGESEPSKEEQDAVKDKIDGAVQGGYDKDKVESAIKDKFGADTEVEVTDDKENGSHTFTFETATKPEGDPGKLTASELATVLQVENLRENADGTFSYTGADGREVIVNVTEDNSTVTTNTKWTITVTEGTKTGDGSTDVKGENGKPVDVPDPVTPPAEGEEKPGESLDVNAIVGQVKDENKKLTDNGWTANWTDDNGDAYSVTYTESQITREADSTDFYGMSAAEIYTTLFSKEEQDRLGFTTEDGKVYKGDKEVTFTWDTKGLTVKSYQYSVTKTPAPTVPVTPPTPGELEEAMGDARKNAVLNALNKALKKDPEAKLTLADLTNLTFDAVEGTWTVTVDGKT